MVVGVLFCTCFVSFRDNLFLNSIFILFNSIKGNDRTNRSQNRYYLSEHNLPWAILTPEKFDYPIERADIVTAHLKFAAWAQSNGVSFPDWYKANSNYRDNSKIYKRP